MSDSRFFSSIDCVGPSDGAEDAALACISESTRRRVRRHSRRLTVRDPTIAKLHEVDRNVLLLPYCQALASTRDKTAETEEGMRSDGSSSAVDSASPPLVNPFSVSPAQRMKTGSQSCDTSQPVGSAGAKSARELPQALLPLLLEEEAYATARGEPSADFTSIFATRSACSSSRSEASEELHRPGSVGSNEEPQPLIGIHR